MADRYRLRMRGTWRTNCSKDKGDQRDRSGGIRRMACKSGNHFSTRAYEREVGLRNLLTHWSEHNLAVYCRQPPWQYFQLVVIVRFFFGTGLLASMEPISNLRIGS